MKTDGTEATLAQVLASREERAETQRRLLKEYGCPLISFTVNMPGPVKLNQAAVFVHRRGMAMLAVALKSRGMEPRFVLSEEKITGAEGYCAVDAPARELKELACGLEETEPLGRLFDMDVIGLDGTPVKREQVGRHKRRCLLCGRESALCARSRTHTVEELLERVRQLTDQAAMGKGESL